MSSRESVLRAFSLSLSFFLPHLSLAHFVAQASQTSNVILQLGDTPEQLGVQTAPPCSVLWRHPDLESVSLPARRLWGEQSREKIGDSSVCLLACWGATGVTQASVLTGGPWKAELTWVEPYLLPYLREAKGRDSRSEEWTKEKSCSSY